MKLCFARGDVLRLSFEALKGETALEQLLVLALVGGGMPGGEAEGAAQGLIQLKGEGEVARLLERAATDALNRERELKRRRRQEYAAWRVGYYIAKAMGTFRDYPPRP